MRKKQLVLWFGFLIGIYAASWSITALFGESVVIRHFETRFRPMDDRRAERRLSITVRVTACPAPLIVRAEYDVSQPPYTKGVGSAWFVIDPFSAYQISDEESSWRK